MTRSGRHLSADLSGDTLLGETLTTASVLGGVLVFLGVARVTLAEPNKLIS